MNTSKLPTQTNASLSELHGEHCHRQHSPEHWQALAVAQDGILLREAEAFEILDPRDQALILLLRSELDGKTFSSNTNMSPNMLTKQM